MEMSESNLPESEIRSPIQIQLINDFENKIIVIDTDDMDARGKFFNYIIRKINSIFLSMSPIDF